jgi:hypothetical protein
MISLRESHVWGESIYQPDGEEWVAFPDQTLEWRLLTPILIRGGVISRLHTQPFGLEIPRLVLAQWTRWNERQLTVHLKRARADGVIDFEYVRSTKMLLISVLYSFTSPDPREAKVHTRLPLRFLGWWKPPKDSSPSPGWDYSISPLAPEVIP